jgi:hypothetical protein
MFLSPWACATISSAAISAVFHSRSSTPCLIIIFWHAMQCPPSCLSAFLKASRAASGILRWIIKRFLVCFLRFLIAGKVVCLILCEHRRHEARQYQGYCVSHPSPPVCEKFTPRTLSRLGGFSKTFRAWQKARHFSSSNVRFRTHQEGQSGFPLFRTLGRI